MKVIRSIVLTCLGGLLPRAAVGQTIVWTDANARRIQQKDVNGGEVGTIVQFQAPQVAYQIHYDPVAAKLYYLFYGPPTTFQRANVDGSEPENIPTPSTPDPSSGFSSLFTLNVETRKLYWISPANVLNRSELDGSGVESHTYECCLLTLEAVGDDLFFGAGGVMEKGIWRADADGSNERLLHFSEQPFDLAHDPVQNKLYLATYAIYRMNLDGTGFQEIVSTDADQIVVDSRARKVYWGGGRVIRRSNLDGSNVEDFVTARDVGNPNFDLQGLTIVDSSDGDPRSDLKDFAALQNCFTGEGVGPYGDGCEPFDIEPDGDVDLYDYAAFFQLLSSSP